MARIWKICKLAILASICLSCLSCAQPRYILNGKIFRQIEDVTNILPIAGAKVELISKKENIHMTDYSASDGSYSFEYPQAYPEDETADVSVVFELHITKAGYEYSVFIIQGALGDTNSNDFYLIPREIP